MKIQDRIEKFLFKRYYLFRDGDGKGRPCGFKWWWRWLNAKRHWYQWLRYEGMPADITDTDRMHEWNRELIRFQDAVPKDGEEMVKLEDFFKEFR